MKYIKYHGSNRLYSVHEEKLYSILLYHKIEMLQQKSIFSPVKILIILMHISVLSFSVESKSACNGNYFLFCLFPAWPDDGGPRLGQPQGRRASVCVSCVAPE